jgi:hypothetical protein
MDGWHLVEGGSEHIVHVEVMFDLGPLSQ